MKKLMFVSVCMVILLSITSHANPQPPQATIIEELRNQTELLESVEQTLSDIATNTSEESSTIRGLWSNFLFPDFDIVNECGAISLLDSAQYITVVRGVFDNRTAWRVAIRSIDITDNIGGGPLEGISPIFFSSEEAQEWKIELFIRLNNLNMTIDDVPTDENGKRDCMAWNTQLLGL